MKSVIRTAFVSATFAALVTLATPAARACTVDSWGNPGASGWLQQQRVLAAAASQPSSLGGEFGARSIVGLWKVTLVSKGTLGIPDGTVLDSGYATWHSDGTELMNSSRPPQSQSFCMGAWKQVGHVYKLNHFALSWDPTGTTFVGPANIRQSVAVDRSGNRYAGTFVTEQFAEDGTTVLARLMGTVEGTRITAD